MKAMCIKQGGWNWAKPIFTHTPKDPEYGEEVTILREMDYEDVVICKLAEYESWYAREFFIPLSSISETEFERDYKTEMV